jgi:Receptor family ligand binding region
MQIFIQFINYDELEKAKHQPYLHGENGHKGGIIYLLLSFCSYPSCSGALSAGLAADMHFYDDVIAFIGPACAFALEPVARLAAYWNSPIITGMGDQVRFSKTL